MQAVLARQASKMPHLHLEAALEVDWKPSELN